MEPHNSRKSKKQKMIPTTLASTLIEQKIKPFFERPCRSSTNGYRFTKCCCKVDALHNCNEDQEEFFLGICSIVQNYTSVQPTTRETIVFKASNQRVSPPLMSQYPFCFTTKRGYGGKEVQVALCSNATVELLSLTNKETNKKVKAMVDKHGGNQRTGDNIAILLGLLASYYSYKRNRPNPGSGSRRVKWGELVPNPYWNRKEEFQGILRRDKQLLPLALSFMSLDASSPDATLELQQLIPQARLLRVQDSTNLRTTSSQ